MHFSFKRFFFCFAIPVLSFMIICLPSQAQHRSGGMNADGNVLGGSTAGSGGGGYIASDGWSVAVNGGYEMPLAELKDAYRAAPTFGLSIARKYKHFIFSLTGDYRNFQPKQRTSVYEGEFNGQPFTGTQTLSDFRGIGAYFGAAYEVLITPSASLYFGLNGGYIFSDFGVTSTNPFFELDISASSNIPYLGPKLGLNFAVTNALSIGVEGRYSTNIIQATDTGTTDQGADFTVTTQGYKSAAGNITLTYSF
jgi:hypothetical protein